MKEFVLEYAKFSLEGTHYDIGQSIGKVLSQYEMLCKINVLPECVEKQSVIYKRKLMDEFCPGIFDEAAGLSDALNIPVEKLTIMSDDFINTGACSQFAAMPAITHNGHILVGRSYEFSPMDEFCLCIVRAKGKPAHIGFSILLSGRFDGINEHGLVVAMSSCEFRQNPSGNGFWFPLVLRSLLDNCKNVDEAEYLLKKIPIKSNINLLLADKNGNAAVAEIASFGDDKKISIRKNDECLIAANHYVNDDMIKYDNNRGRHSVLRYRIIHEALAKERNSVSVDTVKKILEQKIPDGVFCPYYEDGLGTLHSMVFDVSQTQVEICLGTPQKNKWEQIKFDSPCEASKKQETVQNEYADNPQVFWSVLPPGGNI